MSDPHPPRSLQPGGWSPHEQRWPNSEPWRAGGAGTGWGTDPGHWRPVEVVTGDQRLPSAVSGGRPRPARQWWVLPGGRVGYHQLLRGPKRRWWRPLLALLVALPIVFAGGALAMVPVAIIGVLAGAPDLTAWLDLDDLASGAAPGPGGLLYLFLFLCALIPAAMLSVWLVHRVRPGFLTSVAGRLRWRWLLRVLAVVVPIFALYLGLVIVLGGLEGSRPDQWIALLVIAVTLSPFQAAGEEYLFRGWILQNVGSYFSRPLVGLAVGTLVSAAAFAAAHGSLDPYVVATLMVMSVATCYLTWRTGGLETAIVIHATNNVGTAIVGLTIGGYAESFIDGEAEGSLVSLALQLALYVVLVAALIWLARRAGVARWYEPPPALLSAPSAPEWPALGAPLSPPVNTWAAPLPAAYPPPSGAYPPPTGSYPPATPEDAGPRWS